MPPDRVRRSRVIAHLIAHRPSAGLVWLRTNSGEFAKLLILLECGDGSDPSRGQEQPLLIRRSLVRAQVGEPKKKLSESTT